MKKILVITPIYKLIGREEITRDTECVHDLVKYWSKENEVRVIIPYARGVKRLIRFFTPSQLQYYYHGYQYQCDNIKVLLVERQNIIIKQTKGTRLDRHRMCKIIMQQLNREHFIPSMMIVHIPSCSQYLLKGMNVDTEKIAVLHYSDVIYLNKHKEKFIEYLNRNFKKVFCRSEAIYKIFQNTNIQNLEKEIIYSGVPKIDLNEDIVSQKFTKDKVNILYVGKLIQRKNLDILIKSLSKIDSRRWKLEVIGKGEMLTQYKSLVKKLQLEENISFLGTYPKKEVFKHMESADIFCMPSVRETLGLVYLEAMAHGCVTIGTIDEGIDGIIKNGINGYLVTPNEDKLSDLIKNIIEDKIDHNQKISLNAIETAKYFNEEDMSKRYFDLVNGTD